MNKKQRHLDISVGLLMVLGVFAMVILVMKVSGISTLVSPNTFKVTADFSDIGGLKVRAPVTVAGVKVGEVTSIALQPEVLNARVTMQLYKNQKIPFTDSSARILTQGLLGSNYISIVPGFDEDSDPSHPYLRQGDSIMKTQEAIILENLIGQLLFNIKK